MSISHSFRKKKTPQTWSGNDKKLYKTKYIAFISTNEAA